MEMALKLQNQSENRLGSKHFLILTVFSACVFAVLKLTTPYMAIASMAYFLLLSGVLLHSRRKLHISFMSAGALMDITLVCVLELKRSAVATAMGGTLNFFQMGHIVTSSCAVALYIPTIVYGIRAVSGKNRNSKTHIYFGKAAFVFRSIGFLLMFSLLEQLKK